MEDLAAFAAVKSPQFPAVEQQLRCPRCDSTNTKFCYYNNYNLSQPRHFCKNCRRYWTLGGSLRNIPVGGGTRKNSTSNSSKRNSTSSSTSSTSKRPNTTATVTTSAAAVSPPLQIPKIDPDHQHQMLGVPGNFTSLLASSTGHFGNLLQSFHHPGGLGPNDLNRPIGVFAPEMETSMNGGESTGKPPVLENFLEMQGDSGCWNGGSGWPDLAIYTPGSSFQ